MNENVNVCITPKGDKPVLHFSQFDNENVFTVTVLADDGESAAVLTGLDIEFRIRKTDSHVVTIAPESVADNVITFKTTEQMCACCGQNIATVTLMKDDMVISTLDILVDIQRDILSGGLTSESDIRNLTTQIEQIVPEVIGDDYYTKTEVDELIDDIPTFDPTNYYNKSDVDDLLADKADSDDVYTKSDVYNKIETDNLLSAKMDNIGYHGVVDEAAVISFTTDCNAPLDIIKGKITPVQSGTGTPSPDNVRPISGFSALTVTRTGKNLFNPSDVVEGYTSNTDGGIKQVNTHNHSSGLIKVVGGEKYIITTSQVGGQWGAWYDASNNFISGFSGYGNPITAPNNAVYCRFTVEYNDNNPSYASNVMFEKGETHSTFEPYNGQTATVNFGQTVYGGVADVTNGKVNVTHALTPLNNKSWVKSGNKFYTMGFDNAPVGVAYTGDFACAIGTPVNKEWNALSVGECCLRSGLYSLNKWSFVYCTDAYSTVEEFVSALNADCTITYPLATTTEITTTPETVSSISGDNNIFIDTGNLTEIAYFESAKNNLIKLIKACQI